VHKLGLAAQCFYLSPLASCSWTHQTNNTLSSLHLIPSFILTHTRHLTASNKHGALHLRQEASDHGGTDSARCSNHCKLHLLPGRCAGSARQRLCWRGRCYEGEVRGVDGGARPHLKGRGRGSTPVPGIHGERRLR
jgi:hypothetical protein